MSLCLTSACEQYKEEGNVGLSPIFKITFDQEDQLHFYYEAKPDFNHAQLYKDSIDILVCPNRKQNAIDFYRMDNGMKIDSVLLAIEGPNGLPRIDNFLYQSDTIYAVNSFGYELILFSLDGVAIKRLRIRPEVYTESLLPRYFTPLEMIKVGDLIYISGDPDLNIRDQGSYKMGKYAYEVNVKTGESRSVFEVASIYHNDQWMVNQYFFRNLYDEFHDRWLFSFEVDDSVWVYHPDKKKRAHYAGSLLSGNIEKWNKEDLNSDRAYSYYLKNKVYGKIIYDRKHELYYRFVNHPNQDAIANRNLADMWTRNYSIVILDKDLKWVGETEVKNKRYEQAHISTEEGVYLSYFDAETAVEGEKKYIKLNPMEIEE